ncbi:MAG: hypothetical protein U0Q16_14775 [Bryobacteraceae bacterium]
MYHLIRNLGVRNAVIQEAPGLVISLAIAEFFFKFHSFLLECTAFLPVWYCVSWAMSKVRRSAGA